MDLDAAVRAVCHMSETERPKRLTEIVTNAQIADRYRKRLRKPHPQFGTGTLQSAAGAGQLPANPCDRHYRRCLKDLLTILEKATDHDH